MASRTGERSGIRSTIELVAIRLMRGSVAIQRIKEDRISFGDHSFGPFDIGVTNRIRTGTNAFTGRDAASYIMITNKSGASGRTRTDEFEFTNSSCGC